MTSALRSARGMRRRPPRRSAGLTRRGWIRLNGAGATGLALGCGDNLDGDLVAAAMLVATASAFVIAIWSQRGGTVGVEVRAGDELVASLPVDLGEGGLAALDVGGLAAGQLHEVVITTSSNAVAGPYLVRTAPRGDDPRSVRIAVSADYDPFPAFDNLIQHVLAAAPELYVSLGDFSYTDNGPIAQTIETYREHHVQLRTAPAVRGLFEGVGSARSTTITSFATTRCRATGRPASASTRRF